MYELKVVAVGKGYYKAMLVNDSGERVSGIGREEINEGFGKTEDAAIDDFIRRNRSNVLRIVFRED